MSNPIGFSSRRDILWLVAVGATPWLLLGIAKAPVRILQAIFKSQAEAEPLASLAIVWFYLVALTTMLSLPVFFFFGVWRIIRNREYRWSIYGWVWLVVIWLDCGIGGFAHDP
jgi:hypothetical protein